MHFTSIRLENDQAMTKTTVAVCPEVALLAHCSAATMHAATPHRYSVDTTQMRCVVKVQCRFAQLHQQTRSMLATRVQWKERKKKKHLHSATREETWATAQTTQ